MSDKKINSFFLAYVWIIPFLAFILGYLIIARVMRTEQVVVPAIIGTLLPEGMKMLGAAQLTAQIIEEQHDQNIPAATIIEQSPAPGQRVRAGQPVYLVVTSKPVGVSAPPLLDITSSEIMQRTHGFQVHTALLDTSYPRDRVCAQFPLPGTELSLDKKINVYISRGITEWRILPSFQGYTVSEVVEFLKNYHVQHTLHHTQRVQETHNCDACIICDQRPLAGTVIDLNKPLLVHLQIA